MDHDKWRLQVAIYERLERYLIEHWDETEFGKRFTLDEHYKEKSFEENTIYGGHLRAVDKETGKVVLLEFKRDLSPDYLLGQLVRIIGALKKQNGTDVISIIFTEEKHVEFEVAQHSIPNLEIYTFETAFTFKKFVE